MNDAFLHGFALLGVVSRRLGVWVTKVFVVGIGAIIGKRFMASSTFALAISLTVDASGSEKKAAAAALVFAAASFASTLCC